MVSMLSWRNTDPHGMTSGLQPILKYPETRKSNFPPDQLYSISGVTFAGVMKGPGLETLLLLPLDLPVIHMLGRYRRSEMNLTIDLLGCRYIYVPWSTCIDSGFRLFDPQLPLQESWSSHAKRKTIQPNRSIISLDRVFPTQNLANSSARFGNCTGVGPCFEYEYHLNNDIALAQWQYFLSTGNTTWLSNYGYPIIKAVADMWVSNTHRVNSNTSSDYTFQTFNLTDPDEFANFRNNGAFTNAGIKVIMAAAILAAHGANN